LTNRTIWLNLFTAIASIAEVGLAAITGVTIAVGLAPIVCVLYLQSVGWPNLYITHNGPLWGSGYSQPLINMVVLLITKLPLMTLPLAIIALARKRDKFTVFGIALPFIQFIWGCLNFIPLIMMLD
jgi:hypothetical protein